jgi:hypothetical protein
VAQAAAPAAPSWTPAAPIPTPVDETGGGAAFGNYFYAIGGYSNFSPVTLTNANQLYNKTTNTWTARAPIPGAGGGWADAAFCVNPADRAIHVVNGQDGTYIYTAHQVFNPFTNAWHNEAPPNIGTGPTSWYGQDQGCAFIGGKMYLFGGFGCITSGTCTPSLLTATWVYDPSTGTWADTGEAMITGRLWMGYTNTTSTAYAAGGTNNLTSLQSLGSTEKFSPSGGWVAGPALPGGRSLLAPGEGVLGNYVGIFGGGQGNTTSGFTLSNVSYACTLPSCTAFTATTVNLPTAKWFMAWGSGSAVYSAGGDNGTTILNTAEHVP